MFHSKKTEKEKLSKKEEAKVNRKFNSFKKKSYSKKDVDKAVKNEDKIMRKMKDAKLQGFIDDVKLFFLMLKDFFTRKYTSVPAGTIIAIASSLLYVLTPVDIIPDFLAGAGLLDDAGLIALCVNFVRLDIDKYRDFLEEKK